LPLGGTDPATDPPRVARRSARFHDHDVSVQKAIDLSGSGETIQDAVSEALDRARETVEGITRFEVKDITGLVEGPSAMYQVEIRVWFNVLERMHG
jgi:flavin-binding protein dodecin